MTTLAAPPEGGVGVVPAVAVTALGESSVEVVGGTILLRLEVKCAFLIKSVIRLIFLSLSSWSALSKDSLVHPISSFAMISESSCMVSSGLFDCGKDGDRAVERGPIFTCTDVGGPGSSSRLVDSFVVAVVVS